jgi:hypothetical protein
MRPVRILAAAAAALAFTPAAAGEAYCLPGEEIGDSPRPQTLRVLAGDKDDFHPGDPLDDPLLSGDCCDILAFCEAQPGMSGHQCLDEFGDDRPVGVTLPFSVPGGNRIVAADLVVALFAVSPYACNDFILTQPDAYPAIALQDLLGCEPQTGHTYLAAIDLRNVPVRTSGAPAPDDHWTGPPDAFIDLVPQLAAKGRLDLVLGDDVMIDYAVLRMTWQPFTPPPWGGGKFPVVVAPNPAGGDATLSFSLSGRATVVLEIFDVAGRRVAVPASGVMGPGLLRIPWDGRAADGTRTPPGTYFVRLRTDEGTGVTKLLRLAR